MKTKTCYVLHIIVAVALTFFMTGCTTLNPYDAAIEWFSGEEGSPVPPVAVNSSTNQATNENITVVDTNSDIEYPPLNLSFTNTETNSQPPTESILDDLYPEKSANANTSQNQTGYWVKESNLELDLASRQWANWVIEIVEGSSPGNKENPSRPATGAEVKVELQSLNNSSILNATVDENGFVKFTTDFPVPNTYMYIKDIQGSMWWVEADKAFWLENPVLSYTGTDTGQ